MKTNQSQLAIDEIWHDLVNSITTRHLYDELTIRDLLEGLNSAERYMIDKIVKKSSGKLLLRDVVEILTTYLKLPPATEVAQDSSGYVSPFELVPKEPV